MNILIIGEYSGFAKNLKRGLVAYENQVVCISYGDGWKNIQVDSDDLLLNNQNCKIFNTKIPKSYLLKLFRNKLILKKFVKKYAFYFDIVFILNDTFLKCDLLDVDKLSIPQIKKILNANGKVFLSACGHDYPYLKYLKHLRYYPIVEKAEEYCFQKKRIVFFNQLISFVNGVIPVMYDYAEAYRLYKVNENKDVNILNTIPLPVDSSSIQFRSNEIRDKLIVFHGLNREKEKGTHIIRKAMENIKKKYPDRVKVILDGYMSHADYLILMSQVNVIIDNCLAYSYGMNVLFAMAQGIVVLGGNEPECRLEFRRYDIPVINILPSVDDVENRLEYLIEHQEEIKKIGHESRLFVEQFHDSRVIAKQYMDIFNKK